MTSKKRREVSSARQFLSEWRVELLILAAIALAIFLLIENLEIRKTVFSWLSAAAGALDSAVQTATGMVLSTTLSDLLAIVLILGALVLARWRVRWRLLRSEHLLAASGCPKCGSHLHRVHRKPYDRLINGLVVPVRRYLCSNGECRWSGLRVESRSLKHKQASGVETANREAGR